MTQSGNGIFVLQSEEKNEIQFEMYGVKDSEPHLPPYATLWCQEKQQIYMQEQLIGNRRNDWEYVYHIPPIYPWRLETDI